MKHTIKSLMLAALVVAGFATAGCKSTTSTGEKRITPERVQSVARLAAYGTARAFLVEKPQYRDELDKAQVILSSLVAGERWDIEQLAKAFIDAGFKQLRSQDAIIAITGVIVLIDVGTGQQVDLKSNEYAKAAILGSLDGVNMALAVK